MTNIFLYDNGPRGNVMFRRPLMREIVRSGQVDAIVAVCEMDRDLVADLEGDRLKIVASDYPNTWRGASLGLEYLCPPDCVPIDLSDQRYFDTNAYQWESSVEVFNRQMVEHEIAFRIDYDEQRIPMLDFDVECCGELRERPAIYLDNARQQSSSSHFVFELERLAQVFSGFDLMCTHSHGAQAGNLIDCSHLGAAARSKLSESCDVLLGATPFPFALTLTEANRYKPKAVCGYDACTYPSFWDYPHNPLEYLGTMDEAVDFLLANLWEKV